MAREEVRCPECDDLVHAARPKVGFLARCPECDARFSWPDDEPDEDDERDEPRTRPARTSRPARKSYHRPDLECAIFLDDGKVTSKRRM